MSVIDDNGVKRTFTSIANVDYNGIVTSPFAVKNDSNVFYSDIITFNGRYGSTLHTIDSSNTSSLYPNVKVSTPPSGCTLALAGDLFIFNSTTTTQVPINPTSGVVGIGTASVAAGYIMSVYGGNSYFNNNLYISGSVGIGGTTSASYLLNVYGNINGQKLFYNGQDADSRYALASQGIGNLATTGTDAYVRQNSPTINNPTITGGPFAISITGNAATSSTCTGRADTCRLADNATNAATSSTCTGRADTCRLADNATNAGYANSAGSVSRATNADNADNSYSCSGNLTKSGTLSVVNASIFDMQTAWLNVVGSAQSGRTINASSDGTNDYMVANCRGGLYWGGGLNSTVVVKHYSTSILISIRAATCIEGQGLLCYSDKRIKKNIKSLSIKNLNKFLLIKPIKYKYIDYVRSSNNQYGFIADDIEKIFPKLINKGNEYIPNIFERGRNNNNIITFDNSSNIILDNNTKIKIISDIDNDYKYYNISSNISSNQFIIDNNDINSSNIFIYGTEVNDYRSINYNDIFTMNVHATQNLYALNASNMAIIENQNKIINDLQIRLSNLESKLSTL